MPNKIALQLSSDKLQQNYTFWISHFKYNAGDSLLQSKEAIFSNLPTTHTWGNRRILDAKTGNESYVYEEILFNERNIQSNEQLKDRYGPAFKGTMGRNALEAGLEHFVFAYLGTHQPYYARAAYPAFGAFFKKDEHAGVFPRLNATRRDLDSPEVNINQQPLENHFILPEHARQLAAIETTLDPRHNNDHMHYLGGHQYWNEVDFVAKNWEWKVEFHYRDDVQLNMLDAILWPEEDNPLVSTAGYSALNKLDSDANKFKALNSGCSIIKYKPSRHKAAFDFVRASTNVLEYYIEHNCYPHHV